MKKEKLEEKEISLLRDAVDTITYKSGKRLLDNENIKKILNILEDFLQSNKTLCYGGTAINNILPENDRFYNRNVELPDYDFFSPYAMEYSKKLANIYYKNGFIEVEAKSGVHTGTYKVYVNFLPIADITYLEPKLFFSLLKNSIKINAINYCPPNFLRMALYQELSRPNGDISRWEKLLKRLILLNKNYPLKGFNCNDLNFQRNFEGKNSDGIKIYNIVKKSIINQGLVFFGGFALSIYKNYMPKYHKKNILYIPDFDVLCIDSLKSSKIIKEQLHYEGYKNVKIIKKKPIGEYIKQHYEIIVNKDTIAFLYETNACHSFNKITINNESIKIATIDTILSLYLIFIYANRNYYNINRLLCMSEYLLNLQIKNRLSQKGILRRFTYNCYGYQKTLEDLRGEKSDIYNRLKLKENFKNSKEYKENFFRYIPNESLLTDNIKKTSSIKKKHKKNRNKKYTHKRK